MALHQMNSLCQELVGKYGRLAGLVVYHRIGEVPAGQASVLIVAASPHRPDAIGAASECIELIKAKVPIWKKEHYAEDEEESQAQWKQNPEFAELLANQTN